MATKRITDFTEKTTIEDSDLMIAGNRGTASLRKISWSNISESIKNKLIDWVFNGLNTTNKTLIGSINEIASNKVDKSDVISTSDNIAGIASNIEGGCIYWYSPEGVQWEIDSYNEQTRMFNYETLKGLTITKNGDVYSGGDIIAGSGVSLNTINKDLSSLETTWTAYGPFVSLSDGTIAGAGTATITKISLSIAKIDFSFVCTTTGDSSTDFDWGINPVLLKNLNNGIPTITPLQNLGSVVFYKEDGITLDANLNGYGAFPRVSTSETKWCFARVYEADGSVGTWPENQCVTGRRVVGTCYGTIE